MTLHTSDLNMLFRREFQVSGSMPKITASKFANQLKIDTFKASKGWLQSVKNRNSASFGTMSGEMGHVKEKTVSNWKKIQLLYIVNM
jgi:hypothetical protein